MASNAKKRQLPPKIAAMKDRKRRKLDPNYQAQNPVVTQDAPKKLRLENMSWKQVDMPGKLDDYEGFFGLEEIDDVDVVKDETTGTVSFASRGSVATKANGTNVASGLVSATDGIEDVLEASMVDFEEFNGFSDGDQEAGPAPPNGILKSMEHVKTPKVKQKTKVKEKTKPKEKTESDEKTKPVKKKTKTKASAEGLESAFKAMQEDDQGAEDVDVSAWKTLKLSPDTLAGLSKLNFSKPTPIQRRAIPEIVAGNDVIGKASTGSGKTLAFGIPIFEAYLEQRAQRVDARKKGSLAPLALIVSPTRELAYQISQHLLELSQGFPGDKPVIATLVGGLSIQKQQRFLEKADVIVGTPGRLWEVISGGRDLITRMKKIQYLVLDEADRLLSQGHFKELEELLNALDRIVQNDEDVSGDEEDDADTIEEAATVVRQTLIFSATFQKDLQHKLERKQKGHYKIMDKAESMEYLLHRLNFRTKPTFIDVDPVRQMADNLKEGIVECGAQEKDLYLYAVHLLHPTSRTLVFVNSISSVRRLVPFLQNLALPALALHSQMAQKARLRSVERFTSSTTAASVLVATDVAARGLDIPGIDLVVHYHLPRTADAYIHRSGRTARAGAGGSSVLLCAPDEVGGSRRLVARVHANGAAAAHLSRSEAAARGFMIRSLDLDRRVVQRLRPRADLAKRVADVENAKEKKRGGDDVFKRAAEDLGVEYDSEELDREATGKRGRGVGRRQKERADREVSRDEVRGLKGELKALLRQRVNVGVSERYPTGGTIDIDELLREEADGEGRGGEFLGKVTGLDMDG